MPRSATARDRDRAARQAKRGSQPAPKRPRPSAPAKQTARDSGFLNTLIIALLVVLAAMVVVFLVIALRVVG
jgi:hypothetical protein